MHHPERRRSRKWRCSVAGLDCLLLDVLLLQLIVGHSSLDGVLCQHCRKKVVDKRLSTQMLEGEKSRSLKEIKRNLTGAVEFNGWKTELFSNVSVPYRRSFVHLIGKENTGRELKT